MVLARIRLPRGWLVHTTNAGCRIKFAPGKSLRFSKLLLGILLSRFRFTVFIPGAVERIHKFPTAIFSQPTFLTKIWTALFEKEMYQEKPPRLRCSKMPRILKGKWNDFCPFHEITGFALTLLEKNLDIRILRRVRRIERRSLRANFKLILRPLFCSFRDERS